MLRSQRCCQFHIARWRQTSNHWLSPTFHMIRSQSRHSVPPYPRNAQTLRIGGDVRLILEVERGHIVSITAQRGPRRRIATHKCHRWLSMTPTQTRIWELFRRLWLLECVEHEHRLEGDILNLPVSHVGQAPENITYVKERFDATALTRPKLTSQLNSCALTKPESG